MERRQLDFRDFDAIVADVDRLHTGGYEKVGKWDLAQVCRHLSITMEGSLHGAGFQAPWLARKLFAPIFLRRILKSRRMPVGVKAPRPLLPKPVPETAAAVTEFQAWLRKVNAHEGTFAPHLFFGPLTPDQWRAIHQIHSAHHLSFLVPK